MGRIRGRDGATAPQFVSRSVDRGHRLAANLPLYARNVDDFRGMERLLTIVGVCPTGLAKHIRSRQTMSREPPGNLAGRLLLAWPGSLNKGLTVYLLEGVCTWKRCR